MICTRPQASTISGNGSAHPVTGTPVGPQMAVQAGRLLAEAAAMYRQDLGAIRQGLIKPPWDMNPRHRLAHHRKPHPESAATPPTTQPKPLHLHETRVGSMPGS